jgi:hypothetical protein
LCLISGPAVLSDQRTRRFVSDQRTRLFVSDQRTRRFHPPLLAVPGS